MTIQRTQSSEGGRPRRPTEEIRLADLERWRSATEVVIRSVQETLENIDETLQAVSRKAILGLAGLVSTAFVFGVVWGQKLDKEDAEIIVRTNAPSLVDFQQLKFDHTRDTERLKAAIESLKGELASVRATVQANASAPAFPARPRRR